MADKARKQTDKALNKLEKKIAKVYKQAAAEVKETVNDYFTKFKTRDLEQKALLNDGKITNDEYTQWRITQIGRGQRYQAMQNALAERYTAANEIATAYINDNMAAIYALNRNYTIGDITAKAGGVLDDVSFINYDEYTVKRVLKENPDLMPHYPVNKAIRRGIDLEYGKKQISTGVIIGILQGKSVDKIASGLQSRMHAVNRASALRAARTAITTAENAGRQDAAEELEAMGVILGKRWVATNDGRTREEHADADGQEVGNDEPFEVGGEHLMYPGDDSLGASGWNIYNCRCTTERIVLGFTPKLSDEDKQKIKVVG